MIRGPLPCTDSLSPLQHSLSEELDHIVGPLVVALTLHQRDEGFGANLPAANSQQNLQPGVLLLQLHGSGVQACNQGCTAALVTFLHDVKTRTAPKIRIRSCMSLELG